MDRLLIKGILAAGIVINGMLMASPARASEVCLTAANGAVVCFDNGDGGVDPGMLPGGSVGDGVGYIAPPAPAAPAPPPLQPSDSHAPVPIFVPQASVPRAPASAPASVDTPPPLAVSLPVYQAPPPVQTGPDNVPLMQPIQGDSLTPQQVASRSDGTTPAANDLAIGDGPIVEPTKVGTSAAVRTTATPLGATVSSSLSPKAAELVGASSVNEIEGFNVLLTTGIVGLLLISFAGFGFYQKVRSKRP